MLIALSERGACMCGDGKTRSTADDEKEAPEYFRRRLRNKYKPVAKAWRFLGPSS